MAPAPRVRRPVLTVFSGLLALCCVLGRWLPIAFSGAKLNRRQTAPIARTGRRAEQANFLEQIVWSAAEALGDARAVVTGSNNTVEVANAARSAEELVARMREDYDRDYFLTGEIDVALYAEDCEFADPFTSFKGRDRFVQNLKNLAGGFITGYKTKLLDYTTVNQTDSTLVVKSRSQVALDLALPWQPTLGWVWGVTHECSAAVGADGQPAWQCDLHREAWEVSASEGVAMLFRPGKGLLSKSQRDSK
mmetsp:Transcript_577/g.1476  ORF Transcript_577/g.1476 Transcript_577/m.1476 type:complete len:249 (-) Transcript_577:21-767(-)